jgi:hypothetical protein
MHTHIHTYIYIYIQPYIHTHAHTYMHTYKKENTHSVYDDHFKHVVLLFVMEHAANKKNTYIH